jgi:hypothetical protein
MSGCVVQVWFEADHKTAGERPRFQFIETELPDFATFCEMVDADRLISGAILWTRRVDGERGVFRITRRQPVAFRGAAMLRAELPNYRYVEDIVEGDL